MWKGECFVFDNRVSVDKNLKIGSYSQCFACRMPINKTDILLKSYVKGVSCKYCINTKTKKQKKRYITRQKQIETAELVNESHSFKKIYI